MTKDGVREIVFEELEEQLALYPTLIPKCKEEFESFLITARIPIKDPKVKIVLPPLGEVVMGTGWAVELEIFGDRFAFIARRVNFSANKLRGD